MSDNKTKVAFAAINPYIEQNIVLPTETLRRSNNLIEWGDGNRYPDYLFELYKNVASLHSVINGSADYVCGNDVAVSSILQPSGMNLKGQTPDEFVRDIALSYFIYGGFAVQVIRNRKGGIAELYVLDFRNIRSVKDNKAFYYSEDWAKKTMGTKAIVYPKFIPGNVDCPASILFVKNTSYQTYPEPLYASCVKACEVERSIDEFHLNSINNGFMGSYLINFNNGVPTDEVKEEIEKRIDEKFAGKSNAGRIMVSFNDTKENAATLEKLEISDYGERYETLAKHCRQQIFTAFRANPNLFGIPTENLGFSNEEYEAAFRLYNRTQIKPVQKMICDSVGKIFGNPRYMTINPFTIE